MAAERHPDLRGDFKGSGNLGATQTVNMESSLPLARATWNAIPTLLAHHWREKAERHPDARGHHSLVQTA